MASNDGLVKKEKIWLEKSQKKGEKNFFFGGGGRPAFFPFTGSWSHHIWRSASPSRTKKKWEGKRKVWTWKLYEIESYEVA